MTPSATLEQKIATALAAPTRSAHNRSRDASVHPAETLRFLGLTDDMTVVQLWSESEWYTELLALLLAKRGKLVAINYDPSIPPERETLRLVAELREQVTALPDVYRGTTVRMMTASDEIRFGQDGSADLVFSFRNFHTWAIYGCEDKIFAAAFRVLKPGGVLGVVEDRAPAAADPRGESGYTPEKYIVNVAEDAGFRLAETSEVNANPRDTKNYPKGVFALPPTLILGSTDRAKYEAIGESDRMTLKFAKPK